MNRLIIIIAILYASVSVAQHKGNREKIKSLKVAFITDRLELTSKEAQQFWPVYNEHEGKMEVLRDKERSQIKNKMRDAADLSDKEAEILLEQFIGFKEEAEKLDKSFINDLKNVIAPKKTLLLLRSEEEFKRQLIRQYRQNRGGR